MHNCSRETQQKEKRIDFALNVSVMILAMLQNLLAKQTNEAYTLFKLGCCILTAQSHNNNR